MSDDPTFKMYEVRAELVETRQELERIRRENEELKNQIAINQLMETVDDFQRNNSDRFEAMEEHLRRLTTTVSNNDDTFAEIKETLKDLKETIQVQKENEKSLADDHSKLSETVGAMQVNFNTLSKKVSSSDQILSKINETLRKQDQTLKQQNKALGKLNETTKTLKTKEKNMVDDHAKLSENLETIQGKVTTLSAVSSNDGILSKVNETLRKQNDVLEKQNKVIEVLKKKMKTIEKETILLVGGRSGFKEIASLVLLQNDEGNDGNWKELNIKLPYAIESHGAQFLNNYLYIFGGRNEEDKVLNSTYKLSISYKWYMLSNSFQWEKMADMNEKRENISNSSVILNYRIWVMGGWNGEKRLKSVEMYDPSRNEWKYMRQMNECRSSAAAAVVNAKIFCCGGSFDRWNYLKSAECYDPLSNVWTLISDMPGHNAACGAVEMDGHLTVIGGMANKESGLNSVWVLDTTDKKAKWIEKKSRMLFPRCEFSIAKIDDKIFVCGGVYTDMNYPIVKWMDDVEIFDGEAWRDGPKLKNVLRNSAAVVIPLQFARSLN